MTTVQVTIPDSLAQQAKEAGLLTPEALEKLLSDALRRRESGARLLEIAEAGVAPMSMEEINAEIKAAREERRRREAGR